MAAETSTSRLGFCRARVNRKQRQWSLTLHVLRRRVCVQLIVLSAAICFTPWVLHQAAPMIRMERCGIASAPGPRRRGRHAFASTSRPLGTRPTRNMSGDAGSRGSPPTPRRRMDYRARSSDWCSACARASRCVPSSSTWPRVRRPPCTKIRSLAQLPLPDRLWCDDSLSIPKADEGQRSVVVSRCAAVLQMRSAGQRMMA
jgi:hypothetical protein